MKIYFTILFFALLQLTHFVSAQEIGQKERGTASYYDEKHHGLQTSNGERYDDKGYTIAHRTLPFGTLVKITNLKNNLTVIARINDRGPFTSNRLTVVSGGVARDLDMVDDGTVEVELEIISVPTGASTVSETVATSDDGWEAGTYEPSGDKIEASGFGIQLGSYTELRYALKLAKDAESKGLANVLIQVVKYHKTVYRVFYEMKDKESDLLNLLAIVQEKGYKAAVIKPHIKQ